MTEANLAAAIKQATKQAYEALLQSHAGEYYYFSLITTGEAHSPVVAAWSKEALELAVENEEDKEDAIWGLKWSYADSPYYCFGEQYFCEVERMFASRPDIWNLEDAERDVEYEFRLRAMEEAMWELNQEGLFGGW